MHFYGITPEGDYVKKGSIIAKLASNEYQNIIMQNKKDIDSYNYRITLYKKLINGESLEGVKCPQDILSLVNSENDEYDKSLKLKRQALSEMNTKEQTLLSSKNNLESALRSISTVKKGWATNRKYKFKFAGDKTAVEQPWKSDFECKKWAKYFWTAAENYILKKYNQFSATDKST